MKATTDGREPAALGVDQDLGLIAFHDGDHAVGRAQVDANDFCHVEFAPLGDAEAVTCEVTRADAVPSGTRAKVVPCFAGAAADCKSRDSSRSYAMH